MSMIFLIGMPGCGKSYWASAISKELNYKRIDLDEYIEKELGKSIKEIFETSGEHTFRLAERKALEVISCMKSDDVVVACGGGTPVFENNIDLINSAGCSIYLDVDIETLINRVNSQEKDRPLLNNKITLKEQVSLLLEQRREYYNKAHYILKTDEINLLNLKNKVDQCTNQLS